MSIRIDKDKCIGCKRCLEVCPGNLLVMKEGKADIREIKDYWGCSACLKECKVCAIEYFLGEDIGGKGGTLSVKEEGALKYWTITRKNGESVSITTDARLSNQY